MRLPTRLPRQLRHLEPDRMLELLGSLLIVIALASIWTPLGLLAAGLVLVLLAQFTEEGPRE